MSNDMSIDYHITPRDSFDENNDRWSDETYSLSGLDP